jgi:ADP-ribose pyrophosphatase YjhB (NUDIX family)
MIKIHSGDKIIYLTNKHTLPKTSRSNIVVSIFSETELAESYKIFMNHHEVDDVFFYNENETLLLNWFKSMFVIIEAAGGLVKNSKDKYLFIYRHGKWDLPKGKIEKNETIEKAAIREVEEECGISKLVLGKQLASTYHTYQQSGNNILKPTYWFEMTSSDESELTPQMEEGITEVRWIEPANLEMVRKNTYESIKDVISEINK